MKTRKYTITVVRDFTNAPNYNFYVTRDDQDDYDPLVGNTRTAIATGCRCDVEEAIFAGKEAVWDEIEHTWFRGNVNISVDRILLT